MEPHKRPAGATIKNGARDAVLPVPWTIWKPAKTIRPSMIGYVGRPISVTIASKNIIASPNKLPAVTVPSIWTTSCHIVMNQEILS